MNSEQEQHILLALEEALIEADRHARRSAIRSLVKHHIYILAAAALAFLTVMDICAAFAYSDIVYLWAGTLHAPLVWLNWTYGVEAEGEWGIWKARIYEVTTTLKDTRKRISELRT